jgi:hypothetical protein
MMHGEAIPIRILRPDTNDRAHNKGQSNTVDLDAMAYEEHGATSFGTASTLEAFDLA